MKMIIKGQLATVKKEAERVHPLWGKQLLVSWEYHTLDRGGDVVKKETKAKWVSPKKIIYEQKTRRT